MTNDYTVKRRIFDSPTDRRLRRHVNHDSRSKLYPFSTAGLTLVSTRHARHIPVLDQGDLGSCTGNAGIGALGTGPFFANRGGHYALDESGAVALYSDATNADSYPGTYPPNDTGSDGLTVAKVLKSAGEISGYTHTFTLNDALLALTVTPWITGVTWYDSMFEPDSTGRVQPQGNVAGGHEFVADELDVENKRIWFTNSWGSGWGQSGRFWMSWDDFGTLLANDGDVTVFTPLPIPAPPPTPEPDPVPTPPAPTPDPVPVPPVDPPVPPVDPDAPTPADISLWHDIRGWAYGHHILSNARAARRIVQWAKDKHLRH